MRHRLFPSDLQRRINEILEPSPGGNLTSMAADLFVMTLIMLNGAAVILESMAEFSIYQKAFDWFEVFSLIVFTVEYLLRLWSCVAVEEKPDPFRSRLRYVLSPMGLIDLATILPFYLYFLIPYDLRVLRLFRILRLLHMFKLIRYSQSLQVFDNVIRAKREELFIALFFGGLLLLMAATLMYFLEKDAQPEIFASIPAAMWWGVVTLTTVGYGDLYPITPLGKLLGAAIAILGIGMFALPAGILASGFSEELDKLKKEKTKVCPHCGEKLSP